ncbi:uncharacterized protein LOC106661182 isoform X2 [Cimex lectularius]|nr:uncharacterized protein LOC106661182 isoform X2 [Cimex lectularius]
MGKLLGVAKPKRKFQIFNNTRITNPIEVVGHRAPKMANKRRQAVLNTLFMKNITDIMVTRSLGIDIIEQGIEITRVAVSADYTFLNAYYMIKNEIPDLENTLLQLSFSLRHELSQLKLMGNIPRIKFIRDKDNKNVTVDYLLAKADMGVEDDLLVKEMKDEFEETLPPMENTIYGLNHSKIMEKIKFYQKKASAHHRKVPQEVDKENDNSTSLPLKEISNVQLDSKSLIYNYISSKKNKS